MSTAPLTPARERIEGHAPRFASSPALAYRRRRAGRGATVALAALISATKEAEDGDGLAATLAIAGRALVERQARLAARAGARHIVILVERLPAALTAAVDRLRRAGIRVEVARSVADAADHIHPEERVLLFADGAIAEEALVGRLAGSPAPSLVVADEGSETRHWERLDAAQRWSGLALIDGQTLRRTAGRLGEWDLAATLMRQAVSSGARRIGLADGADTGPASFAALVLARSDADAVNARTVRRSGWSAGTGWPARLLYPPLTRLVLPPLAVRAIEPVWLRLTALLLTLGALPAIAFDWWRTAVALIVVAMPLEAIALGLASVHLQAAGASDRLARGRQLLLGLAVLLLGWRLTAVGGGWGCELAAATLVAVMLALRLARRIAGAMGLAPLAWLADPDAVAWLMIVPALAPQAERIWAAALVALLVYALGSLLALLRTLASQDEPGLGAV